MSSSATQASQTMTENILVQPAAGKHAIEVMALAVEWARPLSPEELGEIGELYLSSELLQRFLPQFDRLQGIVLQFGNDGTAIGSPEAGGFQISQAREDGTPAWVVTVLPNLLTCNCMVYDRWDTIKPKALEVMMPIITLATTCGHNIAAVGLQYQDAFRVDTPKPSDATQRLFRPEGAWLTPRIWNGNGPWHIHQGWFSQSADNRLVHNLLKIDLVTELGGSLFKINGQHRAVTVGGSQEQSKPIKSNDVTSVLDGLHHANKNVLYELLAGSVCSQIGLTI